MHKRTVAKHVVVVVVSQCYPVEKGEEERGRLYCTTGHAKRERARGFYKAAPVLYITTATSHPALQQLSALRNHQL